MPLIWVSTIQRSGLKNKLTKTLNLQLLYERGGDWEIILFSITNLLENIDESFDIIVFFCSDCIFFAHFLLLNLLI